MGILVLGLLLAPLAVVRLAGDHATDVLAPTSSGDEPPEHIVKTDDMNAFAREPDTLRFRKKGQPAAFVHIPKTGGTTLIALLNQSASITDFGGTGWFDAHHTGRWEQCMSHLDTKQNFLISMFRSPRTHVLSQFLECRYDDWGQGVTQGQSFPRDSDESSDFSTWLGLFTNSWKNTSGDFGCYNPWNMQSRALTCQEPKWYQPPLSQGSNPLEMEPMSTISQVHHLWQDGMMAREPSVISSVAALDKLHSVGVMELFEESWCLLEFQLTGQVPGPCTCDRFHELSEPRETHHVPDNHIRLEQQHSSVQMAVDTITSTDAQVYDHAVRRFLSDLATAEKLSGVKLFCPARIQQKLGKEALGLHVLRSGSMLDAAPLSPVGSGVHHYSQLSRWLQPILSNAVVPFDLTSATPFDGVREPNWAAMLALDPAKTTSDGRAALIPNIRKLIDPSKGVRAFVWPAVEVRLYSEAHNATIMTDEHGNARYPESWFNALARTEDGPVVENGIRPLPLEAINRLTVITFESLFHRAAEHCFVLRRDGRENHSITVPYPTSFHARSDKAFDSHILSVRSSQRHHLAVLYASSHSNGPDGPELRQAINRQCNAATGCRNLINLITGGDSDGTGEPMTITNADVHAELRHTAFCLEPQGDTPTRSQLFECLLSGAIPVFFSSCARPDLVYERLYEPFLPRYDRHQFGAGKWAVVLDSRRVLNEPDYMIGELSRLAQNASAMHEMRQVIISMMPRLQYPTHARKDRATSKYQPDALTLLADILRQRGLSQALQKRLRSNVTTPS